MILLLFGCYGVAMVLLGLTWRCGFKVYTVCLPVVRRRVPGLCSCWLVLRGSGISSECASTLTSPPSPPPPPPPPPSSTSASTATSDFNNFQKSIQLALDVGMAPFTSLIHVARFTCNFKCHKVHLSWLSGL